MLSAQRIKIDKSCSAEEIANNVDLLIELLIRLPTKSLLKFKSVSKHWLSLITDPHFSVRLSLIKRPNSGLFLRSIERSEYDFINLNSGSSRHPFQLLTFGDDSLKIMLLQSCNGLLLCCSLNVNCFIRFLNFRHFNNYYVFNPTTNQYIMLPPIPATTGDFKVNPGVYLAFDPSKSPHYKVICVRSIYDSVEDTCYEMLIYSSQNGGWQLSGSTFLGPCSLTAMGGVFWNGAIHWINDRYKSLYLDVEEEKVGEMPMPPIPDGFRHRSFSYFGESRGHLHLVEIYSSSTVQFNVFEIEKDYSGWFIKYQVDLHWVATAYPETPYRYFNPHTLWFSILCVVREKNDDDSYLVLHLPNRVIRYNLKEKTVKTLHQFAPSVRDSKMWNRYAIDYYWEDAFHIESLTCIW